MNATFRLLIAALSAALAIGCSSPNKSGDAAPTATQMPAAGSVAVPADAPATESSPFDALPEAVRSLIDKPFIGDLDQLVGHRVIRAGVTFNRTHYFVDKGTPRGLAYESLKLFEDEMNVGKKNDAKVHVVFVPLPRDQLFPALETGKVDLVAAMLTVTPARETRVDFSEPTRTNVSEVVVTGPSAPPITSVDDLAGQEVFVRKSSAYYDSLVALNTQLQARGKAPVTFTEAPEVFEDDDVLEMVNAGLVNITVVDDYMAEFWNKVFKSITVHPDVAVRTGGNLAVAVRKGNPKLKEAVNKFLRKHGRGDAFRNTIERKYLQNVSYAKNATTAAERKKLTQVVELFKKYGAQYDLDYLLMAAQGYQESMLDQNARNPSGAIGIMQVLPSTGKDLKVGDITAVEPNIHAGVKYFRFMIDQFFAGDDMDQLNKGLMTFASYNAGPGRVRQLRAEAKRRGLNPNIWFGNVERIASERIGRETVTYVSNIYKYYIAYKLIGAQMQQRDAAKTELRKQ